MSKKMCSHTIGYDYESMILVDILDEPDLTTTQFNFCPWCGTKVEDIITFVKKINIVDDPDCQRGGCED